jgi:hypothetical protein
MESLAWSLAKKVKMLTFCWHLPKNIIFCSCNMSFLSVSCHHAQRKRNAKKFGKKIISKLKNFF